MADETVEQQHLPGEKRPLLTLFSVAVMFLGGGVLGLGLAEWRAPTSWVSHFVSLFVLPLSYIASLVVWQGFFIIWGLLRLLFKLLKRTSPRMSHEQALQHLRRKALIMLPVAPVLCTPVGVVVGLSGGALLSTTAIYFATGALYAGVMYGLAQKDLLPLLEEV